MLKSQKTPRKRCFFVLPYMELIKSWNVVEWIKEENVTATLFFLGRRLGKSRVCEVGCKVLCQRWSWGMAKDGRKSYRR